MKIKLITKNIILIKMSTQKELCDLMIRFQEFYESPFIEIRDNIFTLGQLRKLYSENPERSGGSGGFTYSGGFLFSGDWNGFNFPSYALKPFKDGLFDPLTEGEQDIVTLFKDRQDKFYIIGVHEESEVNSALDHEICHALFYVNPNYNQEVMRLLRKYNLTNMKKMIKNWGYADQVLEDECHAYLSADYNWLIESKINDIRKFNIDIDKLKTLNISLKKLFKKHYKTRILIS